MTRGFADASSWSDSTESWDVTIIFEHAWGAYPLSTVHSLVVILTIITIGFVRDRNGRRRATRDDITPGEEVDA